MESIISLLVWLVYHRFFFAYALLMNFFLSCVWLHSDRKYEGMRDEEAHIMNRDFFFHMTNIHGRPMFGFFCRAWRQTFTFFGKLSKIIRYMDCAKAFKKRSKETILSSVASVTLIDLKDARLCYESAV